MNINGDIGNNTVIVGDFNSPLTSMDRPSRQKVNKETVALNDTLDNNMSLTTNEWVNNEIKENIKGYLETSENDCCG